jgi:DNA primase
MRIDKNTLSDLRNQIPIDDVIKTILHMEHRHREGQLRFLCPDCCDLHTSTNHKTNLARCFICQTNYNPIDLYMKINRTDFKQTVDVLSRMLPFYMDKKN